MTILRASWATMAFTLFLGACVDEPEPDPGELTRRDEEPIGGVTFLLKVETARAHAFVHDRRGLPVPAVEVTLRHPGDPRVLVAKTNRKGVAAFGPLNPGFYFASVKGSAPERVHIVAAKDSPVVLRVESGR